MGEHRVTMIVTRRFSDGSGGSHTTVGTRDECAEAFKSAVPSDSSVREGYTVSVQFFPAPTGGA